MNDDATISPVDNLDVVFGIEADELVLVLRDDPWADRLTFDERVLEAARRSYPGMPVEKAPGPGKEGYVFALASHPGKALSVCPPTAGALALVDVTEARPVIVGADHLRFGDGAGLIALGIGHHVPVIYPDG